MADNGPLKTYPRENLAPGIRIFHATMAVALRLGFGKTTMDMVARESGFSKGGLLYHFKTKNHLIQAMLEYYASPVACTGGDCSGIDPFTVALLIAAADNPALLEPYREKIGGTGPLVAELVECFCREEARVETQAFAVRCKGADTLLGLFVTQGPDELWDMVDEFGDPVEHEYRLVENGGLIASDTAQMSGGLSDVVYADGEWTSFDAADEKSGVIARIIEAIEIEPKAKPADGD